MSGLEDTQNILAIDLMDEATIEAAVAYITRQEQHELILKMLGLSR